MTEENRKGFEELMFTPDGNLGALKIKIEDIRIVAVEHPFKGIALLATLSTGRSFGQVEKYVKYKPTKEEIFKVITEIFKELQPEKITQKKDSRIDNKVINNKPCIKTDNIKKDINVEKTKQRIRMKKNNEITVKSLNIYQDVSNNYSNDYSQESLFNNTTYSIIDHNRPLNIFNFYNCKTLYFKTILKNHNYGKCNFNAELEFEIVDGYGETVYEETIVKFISQDDTEVTILNKFEVKDFAFPEDKEELPKEYGVLYSFKDEVLDIKNFTMEYGDKVSENLNPFFQIDDIILYRDDIDARHKVFDKNITEYINIRINCEYILEERDFFKYELFFILRNSKGRIIKEFKEIGEALYEDRNFYIELEFDSEIVAKLIPGVYTIDVEFFNCVIKEIYFEISDFDEISYENERSHIIINQSIAADDDDEFLEGLNNLTGLGEIKEKLKEIRNFKEYLKIKDKYLKNVQKHKDRFHFWFSGNPGTGKTKVALELGKILKNMGILSKGNVYSVGRNHLIGQFIGQTALKTAEAIDKARGGILFIDEAYSLFKGDDYKDYGSEVIEILLSELSNGSGDLSIIVAGYPEEMNILKKSNPGLFSRFSYVFEFPDYNPNELLTIAKKKAKARGLTISKDAIKYLKSKIDDIYRTRENNFGNARFINYVIEKSEINLANRTSGDYGNEKIELILEAEDFKEVFKDFKREKYNIEIDELLLIKSIEELNRFTGIKNIKTEIKELTKLLKYYQEEGIDYEKRNFSLHSVFKGNPGTGKTTVARVLSKIYKSLGVLEKGHIIECDRSSLVKGYIGQTAIQTNQMIERAMGGILFIDEAYSLTNKSERDFGIEAIEILLKRMEDSRGKFIVICAGYTDEMNSFLESNPGLKSRFDKVFVFQDYAEEELYEILISILSDYQLEIDKEEVISTIKEIINKIYKSRDRHFGNAREIRKIAEQVIRNHDLRLASLTKYQRNSLNINEIDLNDLKITYSELKAEKIKVGFTLYE